MLLPSGGDTVKSQQQATTGRMRVRGWVFGECLRKAQACTGPAMVSTDLFTEKSYFQNDLLNASIVLFIGIRLLIFFLFTFYYLLKFYHKVFLLVEK